MTFSFFFSSPFQLKKTFTSLFNLFIFLYIPSFHSHIRLAFSKITSGCFSYWKICDRRLAVACAFFFSFVVLLLISVKRPFIQLKNYVENRPQCSLNFSPSSASLDNKKEVRC